MIIKDGGGKGYSARIDSDNRLHTLAAVRTESVSESLENSLAFSWCSGEIVEAVTEKVLLQIKNSSVDNYLSILRIVVAADGDGWFYIYTGGTLAGGIALNSVNLRLSRQTVAPSYLTATSGTTAATLSGGTLIEAHYSIAVGFDTNLPITAGMLLDNNATLTVSFLGNGVATKVHANIKGYIIGQDDI